MVAGIDLQILLRLRPYTMGGHRLLCSWHALRICLSACSALWLVLDAIIHAVPVSSAKCETAR